MNLLKIILIFGFGLVFSSQSEDPLVIPEGSEGFQGIQISSTRLASAIKARVGAVSEVSDLSFKPVGSFFRSIFDFFGIISGFTTSFSVRTRSGDVHKNIECLSYMSTQLDSADEYEHPHLILSSCQNAKAEFKKRLFIPMQDIVVYQERLETREQLNKMKREDF